ncbi:MAG: ABC transporter ATP-binding protein [Chloroflexi bacterium]|nr:ABC transporter ATP-binding protein [Chloroflexota bacterium]
MTDAIRLENVSKKFIIQHEGNRSFQDLLVNLLRNNGSREEFWALNNASFSVSEGESVGIIGHNGSGKSTILKLISKIIEPTEGKVVVNGTISSLLELGAGFHPDLTGRENIFLNGSLLGFSRREILQKFDGIVDFSELSRFIDVPVKHYSSGMYMRLAFSVAINVDTDILLIDEVLAVGDKAFQDKCLERIRDFQRIGKTIIFVSHALESVKNICTRAIWLDHGNIRSIGESKKVVFDYVCEVEQEQEDEEQQRQREQVGRQAQNAQRQDAPATAGIQIRDVKILGPDRIERRTFRTGDDLVVRLLYSVHNGELLPDCTFSVNINDASATLIHRALYPLSLAGRKRGPERDILDLKYTSLPLLEGVYSVAVAVWPTDAPDCALDVHHQKHRFTIERCEPSHGVLEDGLVTLRHVWLDGVVTSHVDRDVPVRDEPGSPTGEQGANGHAGGGGGAWPTHVYLGENDAACLRDGWYDPEGHGQKYRWTTGRASLFVTLPEFASRLFLKVSNPAVEVRECLTGHVLVNGASIGEFQLNGGELTSLSFALDGAGRGDVGVTIEVSPTIVPRQIGINSDYRELGLIVQEIWSE